MNTPGIKFHLHNTRWQKVSIAQSSSVCGRIQNEAK